MANTPPPLRVGFVTHADIYYIKTCFQVNPQRKDILPKSLKRNYSKSQRGSLSRVYHCTPENNFAHLLTPPPPHSLNSICDTCSMLMNIT